jgi:hypothetical protein
MTDPALSSTRNLQGRPWSGPGAAAPGGVRVGLNLACISPAGYCPGVPVWWRWTPIVPVSSARIRPSPQISGSGRAFVLMDTHRSDHRARVEAVSRMSETPRRTVRTGWA